MKELKTRKRVRVRVSASAAKKKKLQRGFNKLESLKSRQARLTVPKNKSAAEGLLESKVSDQAWWCRDQGSRIEM